MHEVRTGASHHQRTQEQKSWSLLYAAVWRPRLLIFDLNSNLTNTPCLINYRAKRNRVVKCSAETMGKQRGGRSGESSGSKDRAVGGGSGEAARQTKLLFEERHEPTQAVVRTSS